MSYVDCMIAAVPTANRERYLEHATRAAEVFRRHGATRLVENWGDDVPDGDVTSMPLAVKCRDDETVVLSWVVWPDKAARDAGMAAVMADPDMACNPMPFDGERLVHGGFETILDA